MFYEQNKEKILLRNVEWGKENPEILMLRWAKDRSAKLHIPCTISTADIDIPEVCPVLGFPLVRNVGYRGAGQPNSPSIDRIIPDLGYVPGNIQVISRKANMMKSNYPIADLKMLARWILSL